MWKRVSSYFSTKPLPQAARQADNKKEENYTDMSSDNCCKQCWYPFFNEFPIDKLSLKHRNPSDFCCSLWQRRDRCVLWLVYRWLMALSFGAGVITSAVMLYTRGYWFIYMSFWIFALSWFTFTYGAIVATIYFADRTYFEPGNWLLRIYWSFYFTTIIMTTTILLVYWTIFYHREKLPELRWVNIWVHILSCVCMLFDLFVVAIPIKILHCVYPIIFGIIYFGFSIIYFAAGGKNPYGHGYIYKFLDWSVVLQALGFTFMIFIYIVLLSVFVYWLYRLRMCMYNNTCRIEPA